MTIKKGNDNPGSWESIEQGDKTLKAQVVHSTGIEDAEIIDEDNVKIQEPLDIETHVNDSNEASMSEKAGDFDEVLQLTEFNDNMMTPAKSDGNFVIAEYTDVNVEVISKKHQKTAKTFVTRIAKFVTEFNDIALTEEHKTYLENVAALQIENLRDLLYLTDVNKQMLNNIIRRVNATQAEDYAIINTYNLLANQHLKLIKELQNSYKSIPSVMKKMRTEVMCNQELGDVVPEGEDDVITEDFGETQFNNGKQTLRAILDKRNAIKEADSKKILENTEEKKSN